MPEETQETNQTETIEEVQSPEPENTINLDQKITMGGTEYTIQELTDAKRQLETTQEQLGNLERFRESTYRLMDPDVDSEVKKRDAREILLSANYSPEQVDEWVRIYDESPQEGNAVEETETPNNEQQKPTEDIQARENQAALSDQMNKMRARYLNEAIEREITSAVSTTENAKVLNDWLKNTREGDDLSAAKSSITERVRAQTLENLRTRRNHAGTFDESWVEEEVVKATERVAKDMLTVIGDPSKIGRVSETAGQIDNLYRKEPVPLPDNKGKSFGEVEGDLKKWTTDQLMRTYSDIDSGDKSKL